MVRARAAGQTFSLPGGHDARPGIEIGGGQEAGCLPVTWIKTAGANVFLVQSKVAATNWTSLRPVREYRVHHPSPRISMTDAVNR